jgi:hypothetical protein
MNMQRREREYLGGGEIGEVDEKIHWMSDRIE